MKRHDRFIVLIAALCVMALAGAEMVGCFQAYDPTTAAGPPAATGSEGGSASVTTSSCPVGEVCSTPAAQCALDSPECFYLCGSPLCALGFDPANPDAGAVIPQATAEPPIYVGSTDTQMVADGSTTADPCVQIESQALFIRQQSCAPCHAAPAGTTKSACSCALTDILNDMALTTVTSPDEAPPGSSSSVVSGGHYVVPGNPSASLIYQKIASGLMPPANPTLELSPDAAAALVYPTPSDTSVLYAWILNCVAGADGGAYASSYYGGSLNGTTCFGPCGEGGAPDAGN